MVFFAFVATTLLSCEAATTATTATDFFVVVLITVACCLGILAAALLDFDTFFVLGDIMRVKLIFGISVCAVGLF